MKLLWRLFTVVVCANVMAGCSSNPVSDGSRLGPGADEKRVADVEAAARRTGVQVQWVNYPLKQLQ
jgi:hypothetical protein